MFFFWQMGCWEGSCTRGHIMFLKQTRSLKPTWFTITKSITRRWAGGHGGGHYNEPGGYLFGEAVRS